MPGYGEEAGITGTKEVVVTGCLVFPGRQAVGYVGGTGDGNCYKAGYAYGYVDGGRSGSRARDGDGFKEGRG